MAAGEKETADAGAFTRYLQVLDTPVEPDGALFEAVWQMLRGALVRVLRQRGLSPLPPSSLGIYGHRHWSEPADGTGGDDALDELVAEAYQFIFVERLASLLAHAREKPNVDGLVFRALGHFVHERQRRNDPLGSRIFTVLHRTVDGAVAAGELAVVGGDPAIRNATVLAFDAATPAGAAPAGDALAAIVPSWIDGELPGLVTARGRAFERLVERLRAKLLGLPQHGIKAFRFGDLLAPARSDLRRRWSSFFAAVEDQVGFEAIGEELTAVRLVAPDAGFEDRQRFRELIACVRRTIGDLGVDQETLDRLRSLWEALVAWAVDAPEAPSVLAGDPTVTAERPPAQRAVARTLMIPRDRLPALYTMLGDLVRGCRSTAAAGTSAGGDDAGRQPVESTMGIEDVKKALRQQTAEAAARAREAAAADSAGPSAGGVYVLPALAAPCEWVVLEAAPAAGGGVRCVPADTDPAAGDDDVAADPSAPAGPLTVRCAHAVAVPRRLFASVRAPRRLDSATLERARARVREVAERGPSDPVDPDLRAWNAELAAIVDGVRRLDDAGADDDDVPSPLPFKPRKSETAPRTPPRLLTLAAALTAAVIGLSIWNVGLRRELDRAYQPSIGASGGELKVELTPRGGPPIKLVLPAGASNTSFFLVWQTPPACERLRVDLLDQAERVVWSSAELAIPTGDLELPLTLSRRFLEARQPTSIRVWEVCGAEPVEIQDQDLDVFLE